MKSGVAAIRCVAVSTWGLDSLQVCGRLRGSAVEARGEKSANSKLTEQQVLAIRADLRIHRVVAAEYGVSKKHIAKIRNRREWKWLQ